MCVANRERRHQVIEVEQVGQNKSAVHGQPGREISGTQKKRLEDVAGLTGLCWCICINIGV